MQYRGETHQDDESCNEPIRDSVGRQDYAIPFLSWEMYEILAWRRRVEELRA